MKVRKTIRSLAYLSALFGLLVGVTALNEWMSNPAKDITRSGAARVIDGDTFDLCDRAGCTRIRLCGINAPERDTPGYQGARLALVEMVRGREVTCTPAGSGSVCDNRSRTTSHGRTVAQCKTSNQPDLAGELVREGHACDLIGFTRGYYRDRYGGKAC